MVAFRRIIYENLVVSLVLACDGGGVSVWLESHIVHVILENAKTLVRAPLDELQTRKGKHIVSSDDESPP